MTIDKIRLERSRIIPVSEAQAALAIRTAAQHDRETHDNETHDGDELDRGEPELSFTENPDRDNVQEQYDHKEDGDPDSAVDRRLPVVQKNRSCCRFCCDEDGVGVPVVPSSCECERRVDESLDEVRDGNTC